jgi:uncharacterized iron-regulated membrane protein
MELFIGIVLAMSLLGFAGALCVFFSLLGRAIHKRLIEPRLIPQYEIDEVADAILQIATESAMGSFLREQQKCRKREPGGSVYWKRVSRAVERRKAERDSSRPLER